MNWCQNLWQIDVWSENKPENAVFFFKETAFFVLDKNRGGGKINKNDRGFL